MSEKITPEIMSYISEIAEKMKNGRASLMIGAGFSKNAVPNMPTNKKFLTWNELGDVFYEKLYNKEPGNNERYLNVLKLAEEIDATFGRTVLNQLIKDNLPDTEYSPSDLHEKLLRLEWKDIFTTNYDTLLERTQARITDKRYNIILNKEDLVYSKEPRIIKLHGSFPSTTPFVITEEDYRQYPKKSAVFVNTVQQALIENILCLIGFSGDDPNFLQWIGWIRDNIGRELASKIYMIGVFDFSDAQIRNLANKNITVINMAHCFKEKTEPKTGLDLFVETLSKLNSKNDSNNWPNEKHIHMPLEDSDITEDLKKLINEWNNTRENYPGWYILPAQKRKNFTICTNSSSVMYHINKGHTDIKTSLEFLFEYNWRRNKCLLPLDKSDIKTYEKVVFGINPFSEQVKINDNSLAYGVNQEDWTTLAFYWTELILDLLVGYRENGQFEGTEKIVNLLEKLKQFLTKEQVAKFNCEKVKIALFRFDIKKAKEELISWKNDISLPSWEMKRAGLLMEMGDASQAYKVITDELNYIRQNYTKEIDYYSMSLESYLVALASYAKQAMSSFEARLKETTEKQDRRDEVAINRFNPYEETRLFEAYLKERPKEKEYQTENFDLNLITTTMISSGDQSAQIAFQFIKYYEEIGMPFNCNHIVSSKEAAKEAVIRINPYAPLWSLILQIRIGDKKIADDVWSRKIIDALSNEEIQMTSELCIEAIKNNYEIIEKSDCWHESNFQLGIAALTPEVLSRLSTRMSDEMKIKTLNILKKIYNSEKILNYQNINKLTNRLMKSMSEKIKIECFNTLMNFDLYIPKNAREELEINDLFEAFNYQEKSVEKFKSVKIEQSVIDDLIKMLDSNDSRKLAIVRLNFLNRFNLLTEESKKIFTEKLWSQVDENGLPIIPNRYLKNYYFYLPEPKDVNSKNLIKKYILSLSMPMQQSNGISSQSSLVTPELLQQLDSCTYCKNNEEGISWEIEEINDIIKKITASWENDKKYILDPEDCLFKEELFDAVKINYRDIDHVLSKVILSNPLYKVPNDIKTLSEELNKAGLPYLQLWVLSHSGDGNSELIDYIYDNICSSDVTIIQNACNIVYNILESGADNNEIVSLLEKISLNIKMRRGQGLLQVIYFMYNLLYSDVLPCDNKLLDNLLFGLERLAFETKLEVNTLRNSVNNCISLRAASCALAYIIYSKFKQKEIRERLEVWKNIAQDLNEFSEVRNSWLD